MADYIDPLLGKLKPPLPSQPTQGPGRNNDAILRALSGIPRPMPFMPGRNPSQPPYKPEAQSIEDILKRYPKPPPPPGTGPQPKVDIPGAFIPEKGRNKKAEQNPAIVPYINYLKEQGIPHSVYISPAFGSAYIRYGPEGNQKVFTIRVPHPDRPHTGRPKEGEDIRRYIDTAGLELLPHDKMDQGMVRNAAGGSFSNIENVKDAIKYNLGILTPVGSESFSNSPDYVPKPPKGPAFPAPKVRTGQADMLGRMLHKDEKAKMPPLMGGDPNSPLHSRHLNERFNLVNPQDFGNYGSKQYDPLTDPSYLQLMSLVKKYAKPPGNDR